MLQGERLATSKYIFHLFEAGSSKAGNLIRTGESEHET